MKTTAKPGVVFLDSGWYVRDKNGAEIGPFVSEADASEFLHCLCQCKPRWRGKIQRDTTAGYLSSLDSIGKSLGFPSLTEQECETITKYGKHLRQTQRGLRNKARADQGNLKKGSNTLERVRQLNADLDKQDAPIRGRALKIARVINKEKQRSITIGHVRDLLRKI